MRRITKRKSLILISIGILVIAASQVFSHYVELPDLVKGTFIGVGIGLLLTATIFRNFKTAQ